MIGIDTNVLLRVLVDDTGAPEQCQKARNLLKKQDKIFISTGVLVETIWVLQRAYRVKKKQTLEIINLLLMQKPFKFENRPMIEKAVTLYQSESVGFSDALILASNGLKGCRLYTFDNTLGEHAQSDNLNMIEI